MKMHFLEGFEKHYFQKARKKNFFLVTKSRCLGQKEGGHFASAKREGYSGKGARKRPRCQAGAHRDRAPGATHRGSTKPPKDQEGKGTGTGAQAKRTSRRAPGPTRRRGIPRRRNQRPPTPSGRRTTPGDTRPQHTPPKRESDAKQITTTHAHQPPETTQGMGGTPARGAQATPTEEATGNTAAQPTTTPPPPGNDPGHHKGHHTSSGRGRRHGHSTQSPELGTGTPRRYGTTAQAPREGNPTDTYPTHHTEQHGQTPTARTQRATHT